MRQVSKAEQFGAMAHDGGPGFGPARRAQVPARRQTGWLGVLGQSSLLRSGWLEGVGTTLFLISALFYALNLGGHTSVVTDTVLRVGNAVAGVAGFSAHNVSISGMKRATREDILAIVGVGEGESMVGFNAHNARRRLEAEGWIASASVLRQFPNTLHVEIVEREPFALWQHEGKFAVIDKSGVIMSRFAVRDHLELPIVVGLGAQARAVDLINQLEAWSDIGSQIRAAVLVAERRWTLYLVNGIKVLLPEQGVDRALRELDGLHRTHGVLNRAVEVIDLRAQDRIALRVSDKVAKSRMAELARVSRR